MLTPRVTRPWWRAGCTCARVLILALASVLAACVLVQNSWYGIMLLVVSLIADGLTGPNQDECKRKYSASSHQIMFYCNLWALAYLAVRCNMVARCRPLRWRWGRFDGRQTSARQPHTRRGCPRLHLSGRPCDVRRHRRLHLYFGTRPLFCCTALAKLH